MPPLTESSPPVRAVIVFTPPGSPHPAAADQTQLRSLTDMHSGPATREGGAFPGSLQKLSLLLLAGIIRDAFI